MLHPSAAASRDLESAQKPSLVFHDTDYIAMSCSLAKLVRRGPGTDICMHSPACAHPLQRPLAAGEAPSFCSHVGVAAWRTSASIPPSIAYLLGSWSAAQVTLQHQQGALAGTQYEMLAIQNAGSASLVIEPNTPCCQAALAAGLAIQEIQGQNSQGGPRACITHPALLGACWLPLAEAGICKTVKGIVMHPPAAIGVHWRQHPQCLNRPRSGLSPSARPPHRPG